MVTRRSARGSSLIEMMVVIVMMGLLLAIVVPRIRVNPRSQVRDAADQMARDLEQARTRALSTRSWTRVVFDPATSSYTGYLDFDRDSVFAQNGAEADSLRGFGRRVLDNKVVYGRGAVPDVPASPGPGTVTFANSRLDFDARGLTTPFGTRGTIYLTHPNDPTAVAAVTVTAGAGIRIWVYDGAAWQ